MSEVSDWSQTPAALLRNGGLVVRKDVADVAMEMASPDRAEAHRAFHEAWAPVVGIQKALVQRGWPGRFIAIEGPLVPPELQPLYAAAAAAKTRHGTRTPGGGDDPVLAEMVAAERARAAQAQAAMQGRLDATAYATTPYNIHNSIG